MREQFGVGEFSIDTFRIHQADGSDLNADSRDFSQAPVPARTISENHLPREGQMRCVGAVLQLEVFLP